MSVRDGLARVRERIVAACARAGRDPADVTLVAVSKRHPVERVREAWEAGQRVFGENYVQELASKADAAADLEGVEWRFIGHLQRNKAKLLARPGVVVETVDSERLAAELDKRARAAGLVMPVLVQVNVGGEAQKSGCEPTELDAILAATRGAAHLDVRGLMTIPPATDDPDDARPHFAALRRLAEDRGLKQLSMGMSADLEAAVAEGATIVRVGTAIFGARP